MATPKARAGMARVLALEVALLAAEVDLLEELIAAGILPKGARRTPTTPELRAGVRFAELDRIVNDTAALLARKAERVREHTLDELAVALAGVDPSLDPYAALEELDRLTDPTRPDTLPGLRATVDDVAAELEADLVRAAEAGHAEAIAEARRQGIPDRLLPDPLDPDTVKAAAAQQAARVAKHPAERVLAVAAEAGGRAATQPAATAATVLEGALDGAEQASRAGTEDLARQAANVTHGLGRAQAQAALPAPTEVYASELLDSNTCGPCASVDGRTYQSLEDALVDYPGAGGFVGCSGGARCRGTLVLVHGSETGPTLDNPGQGPGSPGGPADRTPRGPASNAPAPATGPLLPDPGTVPPTTAAAVPLDDAGRTILDPAGTEDPVTTVAPATVDRDPELATYSDDELDRLMADPDAPLDRQLAAADEYDRRQAGDVERVWVEEDLDAATLARYEDEREAWEAAGGYAAHTVEGVSTIRGGRRIDKVRALWTEELEQQHIAAEYATNGYLVKRELLHEFHAKYGSQGATAVLFEGPAHVAYYYASDELRAYWLTLPKGRPSFAEFAVDHGITDRKTLARARAASEARDTAAMRAEESAAGRAKRAGQRAEKARRRLPKTEGERLAEAQKRRDRLRAAERKREAEVRRAGGTIEPDAPTPTPAPVEAPPAPVVAPEPPAGLFRPDELANALSPTRKRTKAAILKELEATPAGRDLAAGIKAFTETRGGVANLRKNIAATLDGTASPAVAARTRALIDAIDNYPAAEVPPLFRGIAVHVEEDTAAWWDAFEAQFTPGSTIDLNASSFTSSEKKAAEFERMIGGTRKASSNYTAVRFVLEGDVHALPVERLSKFATEKEWITGGEFEVVDFTPGTPAQPYARVVIRQRKGLAR